MSINYGTFVNTIIQFVIIAAAIFLMVRMINAVQRKPAPEPEAPPPGPTAEELLTEIRDILAQRGGGA